MPRPRRSREDWSELVDAWRSARCTAADFARQHGLNPNTFAWWRSELSREATPSRLTLLPVATPLLPREPAPVDVVLPSGIVVRVPLGVDLSWVGALVRAVGER